MTADDCNTRNTVAVAVRVVDTAVVGEDVDELFATSGRQVLVSLATGLMADRPSDSLLRSDYYFS